MFDAYNNPLEYHVLKTHPGESIQRFSLDFDRVPASSIVHYFLADRPGQSRGLPEITPALPLFAQLRRYTLAVPAMPVLLRLCLLALLGGNAANAASRHDRLAESRRRMPGLFRAQRMDSRIRFVPARGFGDSDSRHGALMMLDCDFSRVPEGWRCSACGYLYRHASEQPPRRNCSRAADLQIAAERLGIGLSDIGHYAGALAPYTLAGLPVRTDAEIQRIERELCRPCDRYLAGRCAECGCRVSGSHLAVVNKVAMGTERCPKGKW